MENVIIYIIIGVIVISSIIKNYKKEEKKNKARTITQAQPPFPPIFQKKTEIDNSPNERIEYLEETLVLARAEGQEKKSIFDTSLYSEQEMNAFAMEGSSSVTEEMAFRSEADLSDNEMQSTSLNLHFDTTDDYRRAFTHTLIFDRKY